VNYYPRRARCTAAFSPLPPARCAAVSFGVLRARLLWSYNFGRGAARVFLLAVRRRLLGWLCLAAWLLTAVFFVGALGFTSGSVAYGLLISFHAASIVFLEGMC